MNPPDDEPEYEEQQLLRVARSHHRLGKFKDAQIAYRIALEQNPASCEARVGLAELLIARQDVVRAKELLTDRPPEMRTSADFHYVLGLAYDAENDDAAAREQFNRALALRENFPQIHNLLAYRDLTGPDYREVLTTVHERLRPDVYLEIGLARGDTFLLSKGSRLSIGVDPQPQIRERLPSHLKVFRMRSDDFFAAPKNRALLTENPAQLSFVDGLHEFGQALRDVFNVEHFSKPDSLVFIHDAVPLNEATATSSRHTAFWSGDVWKVIIALKECCQDLTIETLPCPPTGLAVVTNLNPERNLSATEIGQMVERFRTIPYQEIADDKARRLNITPDWRQTLERLAGPIAAMAERP